jgi:hypothetical protein
MHSRSRQPHSPPIMCNSVSRTERELPPRSRVNSSTLRVETACATGSGHQGQSRAGQISAGDELDHFSRPATRRARPGLPWVPHARERRQRSGGTRGCPKSRRLYQFFESTSFRARLSKVRSATTCFSSRFSSSSCFIFFASPLAGLFDGV